MEKKISRVAIVSDEFNEKAMKRFVGLCDSLVAMMRAEVITDLDSGLQAPPDLIVVLGGDGFMLKTINKYWGLKAPFLGINFGRKGFLLNEDRQNIVSMIAKGKYKVYKLPLLKVSAFSADGIFCADVSANDIYLKMLTSQAVRLEIKINDSYIPEIMGDGLVVSTALGSTAYNLSAGGAIVHPSLPVICVTSINEIFPQRMPPMVLSLDTAVSIKVIEPKKRRVRITSGEPFSLDDVISAKIENSGCTFSLALLKGEDDFLERIIEKVIKS
ncbi:MAG: NAD(+)/NADH kinase [bacterium]|nr:NAD(+)/NADH kinase [bacterium]